MGQNHVRNTNHLYGAIFAVLTLANAPTQAATHAPRKRPEVAQSTKTDTEQARALVNQFAFRSLNTLGCSYHGKVLSQQKDILERAEVRYTLSRGLIEDIVYDYVRIWCAKQSRNNSKSLITGCVRRLDRSVPTLSQQILSEDKIPSQPSILEDAIGSMHTRCILTADKALEAEVEVQVVKRPSLLTRLFKRNKSSEEKPVTRHQSVSPVLPKKERVAPQIRLKSTEYVSAPKPKSPTRSQSSFMLYAKQATRYAVGKNGKGLGNFRKPTDVSIGYCYRHVKYTLRQTGCVNNSQVSGNFAKNAGPELRAAGFREMRASSPFDAPVGAVIVYQCDAYGHIELRGTDGKFYSDYSSQYPSGCRDFKVYVKRGCMGVI